MKHLNIRVGAWLAFILLTCISFNSSSQSIQVSFTTSHQNGGYNVSCYGASDGYAAIAGVTGGTAPYSYLWSTGATTDTISNLPAGIYTAYVTDANNNTVGAYCRLFQPNLLNVSFSSQLYNGYNISVNGNSDGNINTTVTGGTPSYSYLWNNSITDANPQNLNAGVYSLTVTDVNGCTLTRSDTLTQPNPLNITSLTSPKANGYNISCNGSDNGAINLSVGGGVQPYSFNWSNGSNVSNPDSLSAGNYTIQVTDANGAIVDSAITLTQPDEITLNYTISEYNGTSYNVSCYNCADAYIAASPDGGIGSRYSYQWFNPNDSLIGTTDSITNIGAGTYSLLITDSTGCHMSFEIIVTAPEASTGLYVAGTVKMYIDGYNVSCYGASNGEVDLLVIGGSSPYQFLWSNGETTQNLLNAPIGVYWVTVTDANGNVNSGLDLGVMYNIYEPDPLNFTLSLSNYSGLNPDGYNVSTYDGNDGSIAATGEGGSPPYKYNWSNGATTAEIDNLTASTYWLTITDMNNCTMTDTITMTQPSPLRIDSLYSPTYNGYNVRCESSNYDIQILHSEGTFYDATVYLSISGGSGWYTVNVNGTYNLQSPPIPYLPTQSYTFMSGPGYYTLRISDVNSPDIVLDTSFTITEPPPIDLNVTPSYYPNGYNTSCNNCFDGRIGSQLTGGVSPYTYNWYKDSLVWQQENGDSTGVVNSFLVGTNSLLRSLSGGNYDLIIIDANGCYQDAGGIALTQPAANAGLQVFFNAHVYQGGYNVSCNGATNGRIHSLITGGEPPYSYHWNTGDTTKNLSNIGAGGYVLSVTDMNGDSTISDTIFISQPAPLINLFSVSDNNGYNISINGGSDGILTAQPGGGVSGYTYLWNNGQTGQTITGLPAANYSVTITDMNGCTLTDSISLTQPSALSVNSISIDVKNGGYNLSCHGGNDGSASITVNGGVPFSSLIGEDSTIYHYTWSNGHGGSWNTRTIASAPSGYYTVQVTDANGAEIDTGITLTQPPSITTAFTVTHYPNGFNVSAIGATDDTLSANVTGGIAPYTYKWLNEATGGYIGSDSSTFNNGSGQYNVTVTDANSCTAAAQRWIFQPQNYNGGWGMSGSTHTDPAFNFIGTTDSVDMVFRTNNVEALRIGANGSVKISSLAIPSSDTSGTANGVRMMMVDVSGNVQKSPLIFGHHAAQGTVPEIFSFGNSITSSIISTPSWCSNPLLNSPISYQFNGSIQLYGNATSGGEQNIMDVGFDGANSIVEATGTNGSVATRLLVDYYCGNDVFVGNNSAGNLTANHNLYVNGNEGIGTSTPSQKLEIDHNDATGGIALNRVNSTIKKSEIKFNWNGAEQWAIGNDFDNNGHNTFFIWNHLEGYPPFLINEEGRVGIGGGLLPPTGTGSIYKLYVDGGIATRDVKVTSSSTWPDLVFDENYQLMPLNELKTFIDNTKHLPDIPSSCEVEENNGVELGDMQTRLLKKVEELTLYIIEQQKEINELKQQVVTSKK